MAILGFGRVNKTVTPASLGAKGVELRTVEADKAASAEALALAAQRAQAQSNTAATQALAAETAQVVLIEAEERVTQILAEAGVSL